MTKLIPLEDHIVVKPLAQETTTKSGIILPESKEKPVGPRMARRPRCGGPAGFGRE